MIILSQDEHQVINSNLVQMFWVTKNGEMYVVGMDLGNSPDSGIKLGEYETEEEALKELDLIFYNLSNNANSYTMK